MTQHPPRLPWPLKCLAAVAQAAVPPSSLVQWLPYFTDAYPRNCKYGANLSSITFSCSKNHCKSLNCVSEVDWSISCGAVPAFVVSQVDCHIERHGFSCQILQVYRYGSIVEQIGSLTSCNKILAPAFIAHPPHASKQIPLSLERRPRCYARNLALLELSRQARLSLA